MRNDHRYASPPETNVSMIDTVPLHLEPAMTTFILTTLPTDLLADDSDQADATLGQLSLRLPGSIQDNAHLVGAGVAIELAPDVAEDLTPETIGFLLRAVFEEREFTAALQRCEGCPGYAVEERLFSRPCPILPEDDWPPLDRELQRRVRAEEGGPAELAEDVLARVLAGGPIVKG